MPSPAMQYVHFLSAGVITVTVTEPDPGDVITDAAPLITWTISGGSGIQQAYRVSVYSDAARTTVIYRSAWTVSAGGSHTIPAGYLPNMATLYLDVEASDTDGAQGRSAVVQFTTDFATSLDVTNLRAVTLGDRCQDQRVFPRILLTWTQVPIVVGETFVRYVIRRKGPGEEWTTIGSIATISVTRFEDSNAAPSVDYHYAVIWLASTPAGVTLTSNEQTNVEKRIEFDFAWLHVATDLAPGAEAVRLEGYNFQQVSVQNISVDDVWGQPAGVSTIGEADYQTWHGDLHPQLLRDPRQWNRILVLLERQRSGEILCFRHGRSESRVFCAVRSPSRQISQVQSVAALDLTEVYYSEALEVL